MDHSTFFISLFLTGEFSVVGDLKRSLKRSLETSLEEMALRRSLEEEEQLLGVAHALDDGRRGKTPFYFDLLLIHRSHNLI